MKYASRMARPACLLAAVALAAASCLATDPDAPEDDAVNDAEALSGPACSVSYTVLDQWSTGFSADVVITNLGSTAYNGWTLTWTFPSGQKIGSLWNGVASQSGAQVTVTNAGWNGSVAPGASVNVGFNGVLSGANTAPTSFAVNGVTCNGGGGTSSSSASSSSASSSSSSSSSSSGAGGSGGSGGAGGAGGSGGSGGSNPGGSLADVLSQSLYETMFPYRNALYSYQALATAAQSFPAFASTGTLEQRRREVAAFLGNIAHETTGGWPTAPGGPYSWGLYFTQEVGCEGGACTGYCVAIPEYPCAPGKTYHGRGPIQLSYNYNYGQAGTALGLPLLTNPDLVASDGATAFKTALWFWMTPQSPKPSAHAVMTGGWTPTAQDASLGRQPGFGMTINIINGGVECSKPTPPQVQDRLGFYGRFTGLLGVAQGPNLTCDQMAHY